MKFSLLKRACIFMFAFFMSIPLLAEDCRFSLLNKTEWTQENINQAKQSMIKTSMRLSRSADYGENAFTYFRPSYFLAS